MKYIPYFLLLIVVGITTVWALLHTISNPKDVTGESRIGREENTDVTKTATPVATPKTIRLVAIGDSLTEGVGDETNQGGYVNIISKKLQKKGQAVHTDNYGKKGMRSEQLLHSLQKKEVTQAIEQADIIFVTIGANDMMQVLKENMTGIHPEIFSQAQKDYAKNLADIFATLHELNAHTPVYLIGLYNPLNAYFFEMKELHALLEKWNGIATDITQEIPNVDFIPVADLFSKTRQIYLAEDHVHPNRLGYEKIAERVLQHIQTRGNIYEDGTEAS